MKFNGKALIADDEAHIRKFLSLVLKRMGNPTIVEAADGQSAVELFQQESPELVLLDVNMPRLDGMAALEKIRSLHPDVVIVMLTSLVNRETVEDCARLGADGYIRKDTPRDELQAELQRIIDDALEDDSPAEPAS